MRLLRLSEACEMVRMSPGAYKKARVKPFVAFKPPGRHWWYVRRRDVEEYLGACLLELADRKKEFEDPRIQQMVDETLARHRVKVRRLAARGRRRPPRWKEERAG